MIDYYYSEFVKQVHGERAGMSIVADVAVLGANAAGLISSSKQLKDIFLAISGGLTGAKLSFDKNAYYEQTMPALVTKMDSLRKQQLLTIRTKMQKGTDKYDLTEGLVDINDYFQAGTVTGAIIGVRESAGASAQKAKKELKELTNLRTHTKVEALQAEELHTALNNLLDNWNNVKDDSAKAAVHVNKAKVALRELKVQLSGNEKDKDVFVLLQKEVISISGFVEVRLKPEEKEAKLKKLAEAFKKSGIIQ